MVDFIHYTKPYLLTKLSALRDLVENVKMKSILASGSLWSGMELKAYLKSEFMFF